MVGIDGHLRDVRSDICASRRRILYGVMGTSGTPTATNIALGFQVHIRRSCHGLTLGELSSLVLLSDCRHRAVLQCVDVCVAKDVFVLVRMADVGHLHQAGSAELTQAPCLGGDTDQVGELTLGTIWACGAGEPVISEVILPSDGFANTVDSVTLPKTGQETRVA